MIPDDEHVLPVARERGKSGACVAAGEHEDARPSVAVGPAFTKLFECFGHAEALLVLGFDYHATTRERMFAWELQDDVALFAARTQSDFAARDLDGISGATEVSLGEISDRPLEVD